MAVPVTGGPASTTTATLRQARGPRPMPGRHVPLQMLRVLQEAVVALGIWIGEGSGKAGTQGWRGGTCLLA